MLLDVEANFRSESGVRKGDLAGKDSDEMNTDNVNDRHPGGNNRQQPSSPTCFDVLQTSNQSFRYSSCGGGYGPSAASDSIYSHHRHRLSEQANFNLPDLVAASSSLRGHPSPYQPASVHDATDEFSPLAFHNVVSPFLMQNRPPQPVVVVGSPTRLDDVDGKETGHSCWSSGHGSPTNNHRFVPNVLFGDGGHDGQFATTTRKREIRLYKNREAARECRRKKKEYVSCLESRVAVLENQNKALIEELKALKDIFGKHPIGISSLRSATM